MLADGEDLWVATTDVTPPNGAEWLQGEADQLRTSDFQPIGLIGTIVLLRAAQDTTLENESDSIGGVESQAYRTTMTYDEAVDAAGDDAEAFQSAFSIDYSEPVELDVTVWIDDDGIVRQMYVEIDPADDTPVDGTYDLTLDVPDAIEPPEAPDPETVATGPEAERMLEDITGS